MSDFINFVMILVRVIRNLIPICQARTEKDTYAYTVGAYKSGRTISEIRFSGSWN